MILNDFKSQVTCLFSQSVVVDGDRKAKRKHRDTYGGEKQFHFKLVLSEYQKIGNTKQNEVSSQQNFGERRIQNRVNLPELTKKIIDETKSSNQAFLPFPGFDKWSVRGKFGFQYFVE